LDPESLGISRALFLEALAAEGVPASPGYPLPLYRQELFANLAFGPYSAALPEVDYRQTSCPNCETICSHQGVWLEQQVLLGSRQDMGDIIAAFEKVYKHRGDLARRSAAR
jgi:hypothetical protein